MAEVLRASENINMTRSDASNELTLEEAIWARDQFLRENPQLRKFQAEIDATLQNVIGFENRMMVLGLMMESRIYQLKAILAGLIPENYAPGALGPEVNLEHLMPWAKRELH